MLVTASSNAACDEIAQRLIRFLNNREIFHLYAQTHDCMKVPKSIEPICNLKQNFQIPSLQYLYQYRVLISTLLTSGCLTRTRGEENIFDSNHFSYIFIDEAACAQNSAVMVPIAGPYSLAYCFSLISFNFQFMILCFRPMHR